MSEPWEAMDEWCRSKLASLSLQSAPYVPDRLEHPEFRRLLGQHQAFMRMRSFIHGAKAGMSRSSTGETKYAGREAG